MMDVKLLEIRDRGTCVPAMAVRLMHGGAGSPCAERERFLLRRAGYGEQQIDPLACEPLGLEPYIILCKLDGVEAHYDPFEWANMRTMTQAHIHVIAHWGELRSGDVVDVEHIMGESVRAKRSVPGYV
jgi:hypothetical protein